MAKLRRSPFKVNMIENDPNAFGLRVEEIVACAEALFNDRSILISGSRGIGKSSLGNQLQKMLEGDQTLLKRCGVEAAFPKTLCTFYACGRENSLDQVALDILFNVEQKCFSLPNLQSLDIKPSFELNLGLVKATLEMSTKVEERPPATIANQLVAGLSAVLRILRKANAYHSINIMIDELDQIPGKINVGHFMKIVHETLINQSLQQITFILAGQQGIYTRLIGEDPSFERIVRHVPISTLDGDASDYVLSFATSRAKPPFSYERRARDMILSLSSGYPYVLHLLGDAAFSSMQYDDRMTHADVMNGIETILKSDKREKYMERLKNLSENERKVVMALSVYTPESIPAIVPITWLTKTVGSYFDNERDLDDTVEMLVEKGYLVIQENRLTCRFSEELFRVFISLNRIEQAIMRTRKAEKEERRKLEKSEDEALLNALISTDIDTWKQLSDIEREQNIHKIRKLLEQSDYNTDWDSEDLLSLDELNRNDDF